MKALPLLPLREPGLAGLPGLRRLLSKGATGGTLGRRLHLGLLGTEPALGRTFPAIHKEASAFGLDGLEAMPTLRGTRRGPWSGRKGNTEGKN